MSYMTAGKLQAFEALMKEVPGYNHYDSGCDGICPECRSCCFHRPYWKYQTCVFEECPYSPGSCQRCAVSGDGKGGISHGSLSRQ